jgi:hypothetical protein
VVGDGSIILIMGRWQVELEEGEEHNRGRITWGRRAHRRKGEEVAMSLLCESHNRRTLFSRESVGGDPSRASNSESRAGIRFGRGQRRLI